ncbi:MAG: DUF885 domain-containing protein [Actinobacteria bacterium]|nr:DUF885 domain-containing protein [Actinomycetota bacterium]
MDACTLGDELLDELLELSPIACTYAGIGGRDHLWDDLSPGGMACRRELFERYRDAFSALPQSEDRWQRLAARVAAAFIAEQIDRLAAEEHLRDLNNIASPFQDLRQVFDIMDKSTGEGWDNIAARLRTIGVPLSGYRACLEEGMERGMPVARRQVDAVLIQARALAGEESPFRRLTDDLAESPAATPERIAALREAVDEATGAVSDFAAYLAATYMPASATIDAVGEDRYVRAARRYLGTTIDPRDTYAWGWSEVHRLRKEMIETAAKIDADGTLDGVIETLRTDPGHCAQSPDEFISFIEDRLGKAVADLDGRVFDIPDPVKRVDVKIAPPGGALGAYYLEPSEDFSRPGSVWWSTGGKQVLPLWDEVSTAYHEGFPGHHLQVGVTLSLADHLSRLHRLLIWYPGYGEGWALYAELLMHELGYLDEPEYVLGMLAAQMLRACRVVIDIGSHLDLTIPDEAVFHPGERWTFELAVEMLTDFAYLARDYAESEVTRYLGWPGQAIAYKVGERLILDLRERLRRRMGDAFDIKDFHNRVLGSGPVGLDLLREIVLEEDGSPVSGVRPGTPIGTLSTAPGTGSRHPRCRDGSRNGHAAVSRLRCRCRPRSRWSGLQ